MEKAKKDNVSNKAALSTGAQGSGRRQVIDRKGSAITGREEGVRPLSSKNIIVLNKVVCRRSLDKAAS